MNNTRHYSKQRSFKVQQANANSNSRSGLEFSSSQLKLHDNHAPT